MFFLARCTFWILLVFACLPGSPGGAGAAGVGTAFLDLASNLSGPLARVRPVLSAGALETAMAATVDQGADWCKSHGEACVDAVLAAMIAKQPAVDRARPVEATGGAASTRAPRGSTAGRVADKARG